MSEYVCELPLDDVLSFVSGSIRIPVHERITRCKDCKHVYEHADVRGRWLLCGLQLYDEVKPEDFCSRGETKDGER